MNKSKEQIAGRLAEDYCAAILLKQGYVILERNYTWQGVSEIDLIALRDDNLLFIEVKARRDMASYGGAAGAISKAKRRRLELGAERYVCERSMNACKRYLVAAMVKLSASFNPESCIFVEI